VPRYKFDRNPQYQLSFDQPSILLHRGRAVVELTQTLLQISQGRIGNFPPISWKRFGEYLHHVAEVLSADTKAMELLDFVERRFARLKKVRTNTARQTDSSFARGEFRRDAAPAHGRDQPVRRPRKSALFQIALHVQN
jgi:hypothetical protein